MVLPVFLQVNVQQCWFWKHIPLRNSITQKHMTKPTKAFNSQLSCIMTYETSLNLLGKMVPVLSQVLAESAKQIQPQTTELLGD